MKLTDQTLAVLKNFATINSSCVFKAGNTIKTVPTSRRLLASHKLEESLPVDFAIYDLGRFLSVANLLGNPELEFHDNYVEMIGENNSVKYGFSDPSLIDGADYNKVFSIETPLAETELSQGKLQKIRQASQILSAPNISIVGNGKNINLFVHDANNKSSDRFNILLGETDKTFTVATTIEQFKLLGDDYDLVISDGIIVKCVGNFVEYTLACDITVG
jgi:hypothetical protein